MISKNDDSSNCMDHIAPSEPEMISPSPSFIDRKTMKLFQDGECLTVFDYTRENAFLFSQGDWSMIRRDLELAGVDASCIETLENGFCREIIRAFRVRKELVHYKKVCLHLFEEAKQMEREFKQIMSFFFWNDGDEKEEGMKTQLEAIRVLMPSDVDDVNPSEIETVQLAMTRHETGECTLLDRKLLYMMSCGAWMYHIGVQKGIHDSRDLAKAICMSPRHPDGEENGERPIKLQQLPLSMQVYKSLLSFREELPQTSENSVRSNSEQHTMKDTSGVKGLEDILSSVHSKLQWHKKVVDFLRCSICARGGFKALAMIEELELYKTHLLELQSLVRETLNTFQLIHIEAIDNMNIKSLTEKEVSDELKNAVERLHMIHFLRGASRACDENLKWITTILSLGLQNSSLDASNQSRLFVASDDICRFVPKGFEFGSLIGRSRKALDTIFIPCMKASVLHESWPPSVESKRTRIVAFDKYTANEQMLERRAVNMKRFMQCEDCEGLYDNKWVRHNLCSFCEMKRKEQHTGSYCLFQDCKGGKMNSFTYCPHANRCFYCDAPFSCENFCRLSRGGGDLAIELVESLQPGLVLLDFDRTFCSTKSGASPLPKGKKAKDGFTHSIDHDLRIVVSSNVESAHIITRNSHQKEIQEFLRMNNLPGLAKRVHVVPKKVSKGSYINEIFSDDLKNQSCLFIDDDLRELTNDPWLRQHKNIHRLLFIRTMSNSNVQ